MRIVLAAWVVIAACTDGTGTGAVAAKQAEQPAKTTEKKQPELAATTPQPVTRSWPADTPSRTACTTHEQCRVETVLPSGDPCCDISTLAPVTVEFLTYVDTYRKAHCADIECPPMTLPGPMPSECAMVGRCLAGKCGMGCDDPEYMRAQPPPP